MLQVQFPFMLTLTRGIDILFEKLTPETGGWIWKAPFGLCVWGWGFHANPAHSFNIFSDDLNFDALILGLCYICVIIGGPTLGEGTI